MKLQVFSNKDMDEYVQYVSQHSEASAYHSAAWGLAVNASYGFSAHYFGLLDNDRLIAVLPAIKMKNLRAKTLLCCLPYCDLGGVLADSNSAKSTLLNLVSEFAQAHNMAFEYRDTQTIADNDSVEKNEETLHAELISNLADGTKVRMLYKLQSNVEEQLAFFKPKLRSQIKKASKNGIEARIVEQPSSEDIQTFYDVFKINMRDLGSPVHSIQWFTEIFKHYAKNAFLVLVDYDGQCVGGGIVIHTDNKAVIPWASTLRDYNKLAPNMLLYWEVLSEVIHRGIYEFDFGRSSFNEGTYRFKKQWGAQPVPLLWQYLENNALIDEVVSEPSKLRALVERTWQNLPVGISTFIGPKIRKYISL